MRIICSWCRREGHIGLIGEKPPLEDFPLFLDRDTGLDHDPGRYQDYVNLARRKRMTAIEKMAERVTA